MFVNPSVVKALMQLKGLSPYTVAKLVHIPFRDFTAWLDDTRPVGDDEFSVSAQLEVLSLLGVRDSAPRNDVVHYWQVHEPFFSRAERSYEALQVTLKAFGPAQAVYIAREQDPVLSFSAKAHFGLRFAEFLAILEVTAHPLKTISFDPAVMQDLSWAPGTLGVLVSEDEYVKLEPGSMKVRGLTQYLTYSTEVSQWDRLRESAIEHGISAEKVASLLLGPNSTTQKLATDVAARPAVSPLTPVEPPTPPAEKSPAYQDLFHKPVAGA
jgi:hypothetical protein